MEILKYLLLPETFPRISSKKFAAPLFYKTFLYCRKYNFSRSLCI